MIQRSIFANSFKSLLTFSSILLLFCSFFSSCITTQLPPPKPRSANLKFAKTNLYRSIYYRTLHTNFGSETTALKISTSSCVGYQFAFFLFPVGRVCLKHPLLHLDSALRDTLIQKGFLLFTSSSPNAPLITVNKVSLTAWDFFFTRKLVCKLKATTQFNGVRYYSEAHVAAYEPLAFKTELSFYLRQCFDHLTSQISMQPPFLVPKE
jgi:hypothetical protein